jgi:cellulose biosynthesis protein BcsQ
MTVPVLTFFNNKGGVGKTSLAYHLAWMLSDVGYRVLACDLDPQANLTAAFLDEERLETLWNEGEAAYGNGRYSIPSACARHSLTQPDTWRSGTGRV